MRWCTNVFRAALKVNKSCNYVPRRGLNFQVDIKWVHPANNRKPCIHPDYSGDLVPLNRPDKNEIHYKFRDSEELAKADEVVKKIFSFEYQPPIEALNLYTEELTEKVKRHPHDTDSEEVKIAKMTASIRYWQQVILENPRLKKQKMRLKENIEYRKKLLKKLRLVDYKRFEWLLEQLDLEYKPCFMPSSGFVTRKNSLTLLAKLKVMKAKEEKLAALKKAFDEQKIPFLEKKIEKLKWIKKVEEENNFERTVTEADIEDIVKKIEKVKLDIAERQRVGYLRKIHPYFLEPYNEKLLREKEAAGSLKHP